ncbi:MAG: isocitrate/isopropylmalate dehydrogenase family protein [Clostridiales bacterium]|nr:isocitrate/isopropylmalate dehydrogenase family protein [Clostridiales bacterium]
MTRAKEHFASLLAEQLARVEGIKSSAGATDFSALPVIKVGIVGGDGIGPAITAASRRVLEFLLRGEIESGKISLTDIEGLTIENRVKEGKPIPDGTLTALKDCHVILKGPTTTPQAGDGMPNLESANVAMRKALDLFANVRPVRIPAQNVDWTFYRENTEGAYAVGSKGVAVTDELSVDFTVTTVPGSERIIRAAFEYAKRNNKTRVTAVTKANVIKTTDGLFLETARRIAQAYPGITLDEWYIDIMTAKLIDGKRRTQFQVLVLPNLYGDILTDEAAEFMGGVGTAGSANIGSRYAMFEAIHGSAPRMVTEGRAAYADPASMMRASVMLLAHIGHQDKAARLEKALDICSLSEKKLTVTGRADGATCEAFTEYVLKTLESL